MSQRRICYLAEPHPEKMRFFEAVAAQLGQGVRLRTWPLSFRSFPETQAQAEACLARAKKLPKSAPGRALKLAFLEARYNWARRYFSRRPDAVAMCWQGLTGTRRAFMLGARDAGAKTLFAELAPLPARRTLDLEGVNAESAVPRDPAFYARVTPDAALLSELKASMSARSSRRADVSQSAEMIDPQERFLFVPLQVPDDSQMLLFSGWCGGLEGFVQALAEASHALPEGWHLRLKEHPSSKIRITDQVTAAIAQGARLQLDNARDSFAQIDASQGVLTVNSSMGLQAMLYDKPVIVTGAALWAVEGAVTPAGSLEALKSVLTAPETLSYDATLRAQLLTWLAKDYYIGFDGEELTDPQQLSALKERL